MSKEGVQRVEAEATVEAASPSSDDSSSDEANPDQQLCGVAGYRPAWLQPCRRFVLLFSCLVAANVASALLGTYHNSMVSTFEKRFDWKTRTVGFVLSANDIGYLVTVMFTAHFGSMSHRPRLLAACSTVYGFTGIIYYSPYLLFGSKFTTEEVFNFDQQRGSGNGSGQSQEPTRVPRCLTAEEVGSTPGNLSAALQDSAQWGMAIQSNVAFVIFLVGGIIQGVAVGPFWNVTFAFIDDMTKQWSGVFIGFYTLLRAIGPVLGYQIGSRTTKLNENLSGTLGQFAGSQKSPLWIGAWWLGYLVTGIICMTASMPLFCFPREVPLKAATDPTQLRNPLVRLLLRQSEQKSDILQQEELAHPESRKQEKSLLGLFHSIKRLFNNPIFMCLLVGNFFEFLGLSTPINYTAKYLEHHFDLTQSEASAITGLMMPIAFGLGLVMSIGISYRFQMTMYSLARFHAFVHLFGILRYFVGMLIICDTPQVLTSPNSLPGEYIVNGSYCASPQCVACSSADYFPVCGGNVTFFSPCVAGCPPGVTSWGCSCAPGGAVRPGTCEGACYASLTVYALLLVALGAIQSSARTQEAVINMRCVQPRDKALALASNSLVWGITSTVVPPLIGSVFDNICLIRSSDGKRSYCEMYDRVAFRYAFHLMSVLAHAVACIFFFLVWLFCARRYGRDGTAAPNPGIELKAEELADGQLEQGETEAAEGASEKPNHNNDPALEPLNQPRD